MGIEYESEKVPSPRVGDQAIEQEIQAKGLTAPRVTPADIEANIAVTHYFTAAEGVHGAYPNVKCCGENPLLLLTFCVLVLNNGFTVVGKSACASPENFDADIGKKVAREDAVRQIWPLMGYELRTKLRLEEIFKAMPPEPTETEHVVPGREAA